MSGIEPTEKGVLSHQPLEKEIYSGNEKRDAERSASVVHDEVLRNAQLMDAAYAGENQEHDETAWAALKRNPKACFWAFIMCFTIIMESFDMFLNGNFVAQSAFQKRYGVPTANGYSIETKWQSALFQSGQCGAFVGVFLAGPVTNKLGYKYTTLLSLMLMNATIFISFFADSLTVLTIGQAFEGVPWGFFIANSPAYASEVVPIVLRGATTATIQMSWSIGSIIVAAVTYGTNQLTTQWAWRIPLALQWIFPTPLFLILFFMPESPWWLARRGRKEEALRSIKRLGSNVTPEDAERKLAMIERTIELEIEKSGSPTLPDLLKGTDLRRTIITCLMYASQNFAGNLIANQATFFFEQAGMSTTFSFQLNLINSCLQFVANCLALPLASYLGRRTIYLYGTLINITFLFVLGIVASVPQSQGTNYAQAVLGILISFVYAGALGPISYIIIAETSSIRLRALSTGVGRAAYYVAEIPMIYLASRLLNPTGWNLAGKCGYVWGGTAVVCFVTAYFGLPEFKGRSYRELDILFNRRVPARKFKTTYVDLKDNE